MDNASNYLPWIGASKCLDVFDILLAPDILELATDLVSISNPPLPWLLPPLIEAWVPGLTDPPLALEPVDLTDLRSSRISSFLSLNSASRNILSSNFFRFSSVNLSFFKNFYTSLSIYFPSEGLSPYFTLNLLMRRPLSYSLFWMSRSLSLLASLIWDFPPDTTDPF